MKILSGKHKNRVITVPENIRPTTSKVREAMFNIIIHSLYGIMDKAVIDICCGSGALGFEALSRGAKQVTFVEKNYTNLTAVKQNADKLGETGNCEFINCDARNLSKVKTLPKFDVIFIDPPYSDDISQILNDLPSILSEDGVIVFEISSKTDIEIPSNLELLREKKYGNTKLLFLSLDN